jgi:DNA modification methylase
MTVRLLIGDCRERLRDLPDESVNCCVTSPPYFGLRDYDVAGQIGLEPTPDAFVAEMVAVFREVRRVLRPDGTLWLNLGDSYAGSGRGGYAGGKSTLDGTTDGQDNSRVARGSQKPAGFHERSVESGAIARAWVPPPVGLKQKDLMGIPWRVAFALQADGWWLRQDIIWSKPNPMPESVTDRCTKAHEYLFLLSKGPRYHYDAEAIMEDRTSDEDANGFRGGCYVAGAIDNGTMGKRKTTGNRRRGTPPRHAQYESSDQSGLDAVRRGEGRNKRSVWTVATKPFPEAHFATYPPELIEPCILAACPPGGVVLDPFGGAGTTGMVADRLQRDAILIELNPGYAEMIQRRLHGDAGMFAQVDAA